MKKIITNPSIIYTLNTKGENFKRGEQMSFSDPLEEHSIIIEDGKLKDFIPNYSIKNISDFLVIDAKDRIILPGFVECHTHSVFAGSRSNEFSERLKGISYEQISKKGGGILSTVNAVRNSSEKELIDELKKRVQKFISQGVTTLEIKSGYGLDFENEIKLLKVIKEIRKYFKIDIIPTFLGAHTFPPEFKDNHSGYLNLLTGKLLPYIKDNRLAEFCDAFCESTAFNASEIKTIFKACSLLGIPIKLHTEQFNRIGGLDLALSFNAVSVDHLEVIDEVGINLLKDSGTTAVLLPGVSYFLDYDFAPARKLIMQNSIVALATDFNPGSSNISNIFFIMNLAAIKLKMTTEEIVAAYTINAAKALNRSDEAGSLELNKKADLILCDCNEITDLIYNVAENPVECVIKNGEIIFKKN